METNVEYFGYSRKSPDDDIETERSIKNQNDLHILTCEKNKWNLNSIEEDINISGGNIDRKGILLQIQRAKDFKKENPEILVYIGVKDSKRFSRNNVFFQQIWEDLENHNVKIYSISKGGFLNYDDIGDRIIGAVNEQAIYDGKKYAKLSEELKTSQKLPCIPAPFGYKYNDDKNWSVISKNAGIVLGVVSDYVSGRDYKATIKDFKINKGKYYRIIKNAKKGLYSGIIVYSSKDKEIRYEGNYEKIISEELWGKVNT